MDACCAQVVEPFPLDGCHHLRPLLERCPALLLQRLFLSVGLIALQLDYLS